MGQVAGYVFQGSSALALDVKGRLTVPSRHRDALAALAGNQVTLTKHPSGCLQLFPRGAWEDFRAKLLTLPMSADGFRRLYLGSAVDVDIDSASRILVPPELRAAAALERDVLLVGMGQRLEIWDVTRHAAQEAAVVAAAVAGEMPEAIKDFVF